MSSNADSHHALAARIGEIAAQCVKCGLCLPACPTYQAQQNEAESPRGRIAIAASIAAGDTISARAQRHLDTCLTCGACDAVCPSNVRYQRLIVDARALQATRLRESWRRRALRRTLESASLTRTIAPIARALHAPLRRVARSDGTAAHSTSTTADEAISLLSGCSGDAFERGVLDAAVRLFDRCGIHAIRLPPLCCGALARHAGDLRRADELGERLGDALSKSGALRCTGIVTGCAARFAEAATPQRPYIDPMELLWSRRERLRFRADTRTVALHLPCTQRQQPGSVRATLQLLQLVPGLKLVVLPHRGRCCGGAGTHFVDHPLAAAALLQPTLDDLATSAPDIVLSANIGCRIQIASGTTLPIRHPLEFLAPLLEE